MSTPIIPRPHRRVHPAAAAALTAALVLVPAGAASAMTSTGDTVAVTASAEAPAMSEDALVWVSLGVATAVGMAVGGVFVIVTSLGASRRNRD